MSAHVLWNAHSNIQTENHQTSAVTNCSLTILRTNPSKTLAKTGIKDIGRKSVSTARGGFILGTGTTSADFHIFGKYSCLRDELNRAAMGSLKNGPRSFSNHVLEICRDL